jgi:Protein of unknown function (DUF3037)
MTEQSSARNALQEDEKTLAYHVLRYTPNLVRDEWINIGVLLFNDRTGERRLRMIENEDEYRRVRRLLPRADEALLRALRDDLESRFDVALREPGGTHESVMKGNGMGGSGVRGSGPGESNVSGSAAAAGGGEAWRALLAKWDSTLSNAIQLSPQKGVHAADLDSELERLYADHVAVPQAAGRAALAGSRLNLRSYCSQVFKQAHIWDRLDKSIRAAEFTFPGDPMRIDYSYRRNGTRGFVQTLSVTRSPSDVKELAYTVQRIAAKASYSTEFAAVTDVALLPGIDRHRFVRDTLRDAGVEVVAREGFAVWVAKLRPMLN